ncbi:MAG TPA: 8-oxo-dGTP diphosphatase MutT [Steroidobacteraceae bacterium]|nr:8-oxo-dGTP diphosphatase MutT [Steroidobacteraceae bacterium]
MNGAADRAELHVVAGVIRDTAGRVLLAQRPAGKHLAGGWEFPGGKLDPGETRFAALRRELDEELGLAVLAGHPLIRIRHRYAERRVLLDVWLVTRRRGEPEGRDGQALRWCDVDGLGAAGVLPADRPVITALRLPARLTVAQTAVYRLIADRAGLAAQRPASAGETLRGVRCGALHDAVAAAAAGADFLALRAPLAPEALAVLCETVNVPVYARGLALDDAWALGASGVDASPIG